MMIFFSLLFCFSAFAIGGRTRKTCLAAGILLTFSFPNVSAQDIERKIIIQNGRFYYSTIDAEFQMATLHTGTVSEPIRDEKKLALPAGRNYDEPLNPFAYDVSGGIVYAVSFLNHPLNDRNEALKRIPLSGLQPWSEKVTIPDMLMYSVDHNTFAMNEPYTHLLSTSDTLNNFFYDGIAESDSSYYFALVNNGRFCLWNFNGKQWKQGKTQLFPADGPFSILESYKQLYLVASSGEIMKLSMDSISFSGRSVENTTASGIFIINKDDNSIAFLKNNLLDRNTPLNELIRKKAIKLF